jgi:hypothetical protein
MSGMDTLTTPGQNVFVYDLEIYPNYFLALFKALDNDQWCSFIIEESASSQKNEETLLSLFDFVSVKNTWLIGYNSFRFDDTILRQMFSNQLTDIEDIYRFMEKVIANTDKDRKSLNKLWYEQNKNFSWKCVDLMEIKPGSIAGKTREWSLKKHQGRLRWHNLQELPIKPGSILSVKEKADILEYCKNDVLSTEALFHHFEKRGVISSRDDIANHYPEIGFESYHLSEPAIAGKILGNRYEEETGKTIFDIPEADNFFHPSKFILNALSFQDEGNQLALDYLRALRPQNCYALSAQERNNPPDNHIAYHLKKINFKFGDFTISPSLGGLHLNFRGKVVQSLLVEFDVTSFYPNLVQLFNRSPGRTGKEWLKIYVGMKEQRETLKKSENPEDKRLADIYKIVINSITGKFRQKGDLSFDPSLATQVNLNGQLALCMLCEMFAFSNIPIIYANTDGVLVDVGKNNYESVVKIAREWEEKISGDQPEKLIRLEETHFSCIVAESISDYQAVKEDGSFKRRGNFANISNQHPSIVREAVFQKLYNDIAIEETIKNCPDILDFAFITSIQKRNADEVKWGETLTQHINRVYHSIDGQLLRGFKDNQEKSPPKGIHSVHLLNKIEEKKYTNIDYNRYIDDANQLLEKITHSTCGEANELLSKAIKAAEKFPELTIVPKGSELIAKKSYKHFMETSVKDIPLENHPWEEFNGFGAVTGQEFGVIGIDIDYPEIAEKDGLYDVLFPTKTASKNCLICHHQNNVDSVQEHEAKGTILFKYSDGDIKTITNPRFSKSHGYEILYGKRIVQMSGIHQNGSRYKVAGKLTNLPEALKEKILHDFNNELLSKTPLVIDEEETESDAVSHKKTEWLLSFQKAAKNLEKRPITLNLDAHNGNPQLKGRCPYNHTDDQNDHFFVQVNERRIYSTICHHQKCTKTRNEWLRLVKQSVILKPDTIENPYTLESIEEVDEFYNDDTQHKLLIGPTGIGKTYGLSKWICHLLKETEEKVCVIVSSTAEQQTLGIYLHSMLCGGENQDNHFKEYGIAIVERGNKVNIGNNYKSKAEIPKNTRIAILNKTHISVKGFSNHYYAYLKWIKENKPHVVVDEIDNAISNGWGTTTHLGGNVVGTPERGGQFTLSCPWYEGNGNCLSCYQVKYEGYIKYNQYKIPEWTYDAEPHPNKNIQEHPHINLPGKEINNVELNRVEVISLEMASKPMSFQIGNGEHSNAQQVFEHKIQNSYYPTLYKHFPSINGERVSSEEMVEQYSSEDRKSLEFPDNVVAIPPTKACKALFITTLDRAPLQFLQSNSQSLALMTATLPPSNLDFLTALIPNLSIKEVIPKQSRVMEKIILIGIQDKLDKTLAPVLNGEFMPLIFERTQQFAWNLHSKLKDDYKNKRINNPTLWDKDNKIAKADGKVDINSSDAVITYSHGVYGRGVNLGIFKEIWVNDNVQKATCLYPTKDADELEELIDEDKFALISQNLGRVFRAEEGETTPFRIAVIYRLDNNLTLNRYQEKLQKMSRGPVEAVFIPIWAGINDIKEFLDYVRKNQSFPDKLPFTEEYLIEKAGEMGQQGKSLTTLKKEFLNRVTKRIPKETIDKIIRAHTERLSLFKQNKNTLLEEKKNLKKNQNWEAKRLKTLNSHLEKGNPLGVIKRDMRYQEFTDKQKEWFDDAFEKHPSNPLKKSQNGTPETTPP